MIYLHKFLPLLVSPLALILYLTLLAFITRRRAVIALGLIATYALSTPYVAGHAKAHLEKDYPSEAVADLPESDHVIVLGGMTRTVRGERGGIRRDFTDGVDRLHAGIDILRTGKAHTLHLTRGQLPWSVGSPEGEFLREVAERYGVDPRHIRLTPEAQNTAQEAAHFADTFRPGEKIILVTSAFHMPRALRLFHENGIYPTPHAVDHRAGVSTRTPMDFLPDAGALSDLSDAWRELLGRAYYALKQ